MRAPPRRATAIPLLPFLITARFDSLHLRRRPVKEACVRIRGVRRLDGLPWTEQAGEWPWRNGEDWVGGHGGLDVRMRTWAGARLLWPPRARARRRLLARGWPAQRHLPMPAAPPRLLPHHVHA
jgi:hypothetical protein